MKVIIALFISLAVFEGSAIEDGSIKIQSGDFGVIEVYHKGSWGKICADDYSDDNEIGDVACRMVGYKKGEIYFYPGFSYNWFVSEDIFCDGDEDNLDECDNYHFEYDDDCDEFYGVSCTGKSSDHACGGRVCDDDDKFCCYDGFYGYYCCDDLEHTTTSRFHTMSTTTTTSLHHGTNFRISIWWIVCIVVAFAVVVAFIAARYRRSISFRRSNPNEPRSIPVQPSAPREENLGRNINRAYALPTPDAPPDYSMISKPELNGPIQPPPYSDPKSNAELYPPPYDG